MTYHDRLRLMTDGYFRILGAENFVPKHDYSSICSGVIGDSVEIFGLKTIKFYLAPFLERTIF